MDQPKTDKFSELSPVLELVYVMLTNMAKYMDVYATDIDAAQNEQYVQAKDAVDTAIRKFDTIYGLKSPASISTDEKTTSGDATFVDEVAAEPETTGSPVEKIEEKPQGTSVVTPATEQPYEFASGNDPESLKKAKQAVEELKTLFADMKKQEAEAQQAPVVPASSPAETVTPEVPADVTTPAVAPVQAPVSEAAPTPTFVTPSASPVVSTPDVQPVNTTPAPQTPSVPAPTSDAGDVDSILAELKKLQNKGNTQL